jgi:hypothetical protein
MIEVAIRPMEDLYLGGLRRAKGVVSHLSDRGMGSPSVISKKEKLIDPIRDIEVELIGRDERAREGEGGGREPCQRS